MLVKIVISFFKDQNLIKVDLEMNLKIEPELDSKMNL